MIARDLFAEYVREALADLCNPMRLETNPLASLLPANPPAGLTRAQALRQVLREAIEALRPEPEVPPDRPEWLGYQLLYQRYVRGIGQIVTCEQLGLSRATYYRRQQEAVEAVTCLLWERYRQSPSFQEQTAAQAGLSPDEQAREEALRLARAAPRTLVDLDELLRGIIETIRPLAAQQGMELNFHVPSPLPATYGDPITFRQIILNVLTEGIRLAAGDTLEFLVSLEGQEILWQLQTLDEARLGGRSLDQVSGFVVSRGLLELYGGRLWLDREETGRAALLFSLPITHPRTILIIDDDADTVRLYRRYLEIYGYHLQEAPNGAQAWAILAESRPDLILLDVLMPREDGWGILQRLKTTPETASIPVVICSVLSQPQLALALGAARVLRKPITEKMLLEALRALLGQADT